MKKLINKLEKTIKSLKNFNKFKHLFSDDKAEKQIAELRRALVQILLKVKLTQIKKISHPKNKALTHSKRMGLVKVRPCNKKI